ncbi:MAG: hypothetical protein KAI45_13435, partial [Melioribacteraceae bacterium]|nr:hypothetical protein [Melioribacteraceae bacterium]
AFQGEYESAAVNVFNFSGSARTLHVGFSEFSGPEEKLSVSTDDVFTLCETIDVPTQDATRSADALPELNAGDLLVIPAWEGRQLWIKINSTNLTPGIWKAKIHLKSLDVQFVETEVELNIKIWDVPFPKEQPLSLCNWSGTSKPEGTFTDQISHGVNVFTQTIPAKIVFNESGEITDIDWSDHDAFMESQAAKGTLLFHSLVSISGSSSAFSPAWLKAYRIFIPQWIKHLKELGYGYDNFAFYPVDEPGLENGKKVNQFMKWAKLVRDIDPSIRIYANPAEQITKDQLKEMNPYVDIWTPHQTHLFPKKELNYIQSTNGLLWNYECLENAKNLSPLGYYRGQAWMSWSYGHTGIGFYTYYQGRNFWFQPESGFEYAMIYEGKGVVTSKRWEAVRDGVEDYTLLYALKNAIDTAEKSRVKNELVEKSKNVLNHKAAVIAKFIDNNKVNKTDGAVARKIADKRWKKITEIRTDIAELLVQLQK